MTRQFFNDSTEIGFAGLLTQNYINCPVMQYIVLSCGTSLRQINIMEVAVKITIYNTIRVRWIRAENDLQRFFALLKEIPIFLKNEVKSDTTELENQMVDPQYLADLHF